MSLELAVQNLTAEIITLRQLLQSQSGNVQSQQSQAPVAPLSFAPPAAAPVAAPVVAAPVFTPPVAQFQPPVQAAPPVVQAPAPGACPIVDQKSLVEYVTATYKEVGPQRGASIQGVLNNCQIQSINECRPEHYAYIYECLEQIRKGS